MSHRERPAPKLAQRLLKGAHERIGALAEPMPGALAILDFFAERAIPTAIASASPMSLIELVIDRMGIRSQLTVWHSATLEPRNKPAPDVYLGTARKLGIEPRKLPGVRRFGYGTDLGTGRGYANRGGARRV